MDKVRSAAVLEPRCPDYNSRIEVKTEEGGEGVLTPRGHARASVSSRKALSMASATAGWSRGTMCPAWLGSGIGLGLG